MQKKFGSSSQEYKEDEVRHEYGHTRQLEQLGAIKYAIGIGIPSMCALELHKYGIDYYAQRYEITADMYGGVRSRSYPEMFSDAGLRYLEELEQLY